MRKELFRVIYSRTFGRYAAINVHAFTPVRTDKAAAQVFAGSTSNANAPVRTRPACLTCTHMWYFPGFGKA